jgi:hypothetical protein
MGVNLQNYLNFQFSLIFRIFRLDRPHQSSEIFRDNYLNKFFFLFLSRRSHLSRNKLADSEKSLHSRQPPFALLRILLKVRRCSNHLITRQLSHSNLSFRAFMLAKNRKFSSLRSPRISLPGLKSLESSLQGGSIGSRFVCLFAYFKRARLAARTHCRRK